MYLRDTECKDLNWCVKYFRVQGGFLWKRKLILGAYKIRIFFGWLHESQNRLSSTVSQLFADTKQDLKGVLCGIQTHSTRSSLLSTPVGTMTNNWGRVFPYKWPQVTYVEHHGPMLESEEHPKVKDSINIVTRWPTIIQFKICIPWKRVRLKWDVRFSRQRPWGWLSVRMQRRVVW